MVFMNGTDHLVVILIMVMGLGFGSRYVVYLEVGLVPKPMFLLVFNLSRKPTQTPP